MPSASLDSEIRQLVITTLGLQLSPPELSYSAKLFDSELGLDSVDMVSVIIGVERQFGIIVPEDVDVADCFSTISNIAELVSSLRTEATRDAP